MRRFGAAVVAVVLLLAGCSGSRPRQREVIVFAAASLTETFTRVAKEFQDLQPGTRLVLNFGGSSALATQINQGAPAAVFASASPVNMRAVLDAGNVDGSPVVFVRNQLVVAVPAGDPRRVTGLADLARPGVKVALCAEQVPCGAAARRALEAAGVAVRPVTLEQDVKAALAKVRLGEVDAALVYRTDVRAAGSAVVGIEFPESASAVNDYPVAVLRSATDQTAARAFVDFVLSARAREIFVAAGFQTP